MLKVDLNTPGSSFRVPIAFSRKTGPERFRRRIEISYLRKPIRYLFQLGKILSTT
jgi:hypothetical protein